MFPVKRVNASPAPPAPSLAIASGQFFSYALPQGWHVVEDGQFALTLAAADGAVVDLCPMHRVAGIRAREVRIGQTIAGRKVTEVGSHRGETHSYDLLTEDAGYQIHGVPVNSMIEEMHAAWRKSAAAGK